MASLPPLPAGATLIEDSPAPRRQRRDPWEVLQEDGFTLNNGYRARGDQERIRRQGYRPARNSDHLRGDAVDLGHPTYSPQRMERRARELLSDYPEARYLYHDGHLHVGVPGWRAAPGTPGTANFGLPPLPQGAELVQRGNYASDNYQPGAGAPSAPPAAADGSYPEIAMSGPNWGRPVNALAGPPVDANALLSFGAGAAQAALPGAPAPHRVQSANDGMDTIDERARGAMEQSLAALLRGDPDAQVLGILEAGGVGPDRYAVPGSNIMQMLAQRADMGPEAFRRQYANTSVGASSFTFPEGMQWPQADYTGETVTGPDGVEYREVRGEGGTQWVTRDGVRYFRNQTGAQSGTGPEFNRVPGQQGFEAEEAALRERFPESYGRDTSLLERLAAAPGRGIAELAGAPVDLVNGTMRTLGLPVSDNPLLGSNFLKDNWEVPGAAVVNALGGNAQPLSLRDGRFDARGPMEDFAQRSLYFVGSNALPAMGLYARGGQLINRLGPVGAAAPRGGPIGGAIDNLAVGSAARPAATVRAEVLSGVGAAGGQELARTLFPGSPTAEMLGIVGGGVGGGVAGARIGLRSAPSETPQAGAPPRIADPVEAQGAAPAPGGRVPDRIDVGYPGLSRLDAALPAPAPRSPDRIDITDSAYSRAAASIDPGPTALPGRAPVRSQAMEREDLPPSVSSEVVTSDLPPLPPGARPLDPSIGRMPDLIDQPDPAALAGIARSINPEDVLPRPANRLISLDEHIAQHDGRWRDVPAPNERAELTVRNLPHPTRPGETVRFAGPIDAETFLRMRGGIQDQAGELRHMGIVNNRPRPDVPGEDRLGRLLNPNGMTLDDAGEALWEAGYFPNSTTRPSVDEVLDMLSASRNGERTVLPDDVDELTRYHQAQAQRYAVESAAQEGAPLTEDISRPAGEANVSDDIPLTAYEDLPTITDRVGNINLANIDSAEDIGRMLQNVEAAFGGFDAARRGRIGFGEIAALADELGMTADDLMRRRPGQALNAEQALAARSILAKSSDEVIGLARRAQGGTEADKAAFAQALLRHAAIHEQVSGAVSEAGRALSSLRATASSRAVSGRIHELSVSSLGGESHLDEVADRILELQRQGVGPGQVTQFAIAATKPRLRDMLQELWYNSLLSGPQTHAVNTLSNVLTGLGQFPEQLAAAAFGQGRRAIRRATGRIDDFDRVTFSEIGPRVIGYLQGTREGLRSFGRTFRTGEVVDQVTKVESRIQEAIPGRTGQVIRTPSRLLAAEDEFFKAIARRMELGGLAARQARAEGLRGQAYAERVADLQANPPTEMLERALDYARYQTFQRPLGPVGRRVMQTTQEHPWLKLFFPFIRTPTNILKYAVERSPAAPLLREVRADIRRGGERRHLAFARMALGTGLGMTIMQMVEQGIITGGEPAWRGAGEMMRADGWQPYSIRIGDTYYSYQRLDPLALTLGVAADLQSYSQYMTPKQADQAGAMLIASIMGNLSDKTWLSGASDLLGSLSDPQRNLSSTVARLTGSITVPALVSQTARWLDPVQRDTRAPNGEPTGYSPMVDRVLGTLQSRIPGMSQNLPANRDVFGRDVTREGGVGPDWASPIWTRAARNDPIIRELLDNMLSVGRASRRLKVNGVSRDLTPNEYGRYQELSGQLIYQDMQGLVGGPEWAGMNQEARRRAVDRLKRQARAAARSQLFGSGTEDDDAPPLPRGATVPPLPAGAVPVR